MLDTAREARVVRHAAARARALGVPAEPVRGLFWGIIALCRDEQIGVRRRGTGPRRRHALRHASDNASGNHDAPRRGGVTALMTTP